MNTTALIQATLTHALKLGRFERVNGHEPKAAPGTRLTCAIWVQRISPAIGHGLAATTARVELSVRIYSSMLAEPQDQIEPDMAAAVDDLMAAYAGDVTLGGTIRNVDLLGQAGPPMEAVAGYLTVDTTLFRIVTITLPLIVNDAWTQAA